MFDGILGKYTGSNNLINIKKDAKPFHSKSFPSSKFYEPTFKKDVDSLNNIRVLKKINNTQCAATAFILPKVNVWHSKIYL